MRILTLGIAAVVYAQASFAARGDYVDEVFLASTAHYPTCWVKNAEDVYEEVPPSTNTSEWQQSVDIDVVNSNVHIELFGQNFVLYATRAEWFADLRIVQSFLTERWTEIREIPEKGRFSTSYTFTATFDSTRRPELVGVLKKNHNAPFSLTHDVCVSDWQYVTGTLANPLLVPDATEDEIQMIERKLGALRDMIDLAFPDPDRHKSRNIRDFMLQVER